MMSSPFTQWLNFILANALHLAGIVVLALLGNHFLRKLTDSLVKPAAAQSRTAQARELQTRTLASGLYGVGSKVIWAVAILTALPEFGISVLPAVVILGLTTLGLGVGARNVMRDVLAGYQIVFEDQYTIGDTIQTAQASGKVESLTLRRTVLRDASGALVTLANGDIRTVGNLSRDWSQAFVDVSVSAQEPLEKALQALETASGALRSDPSWSQAIVDGPRVLGVQSYGRTGPTLRIQVRTAPMRQNEIARELRRRIQIEFQRQRILISSARDFEQASAFRAPEEHRSED